MSKGQQRSILLSGLGFYRLALERRKTLTIVLTASLVVHAIGLIVAGGWVVMRHRTANVTIFETPPPQQTYEPRKLEHKVKVQKRQRSSSRPSLVPRIVSLKTSDLALPDIKMDPKVVKTTFQPKFKAVSGMGLGAGLGTGHGVGGFGAGVSSVNFFGIHARGEKIAVLVDVSVSMVEEERGGVKGYMRVKNRLERVVDALSPGSIFTVIAFADAAQALSDKMLVANEENKKNAKLFIRPFNSEGNWGLSQGNVRGNPKGLRALGGTTRLDLAIGAAMARGADTILLISDGLPRVRRGHSTAERDNHREMVRNWHSSHRGDLETWQAAAGQWDTANAGATFEEEKVWVPAQPARPAVPARPPSKTPPSEGQAVDRGSPAQPAQPARAGYYTVVQRRVGGARGARPARPAPPSMPAAGWWKLQDFVEHISRLHEHYYKPKGAELPEIHGIGYQIDKDGHEFLNALSRHYRGQYRRVRKLR